MLTLVTQMQIVVEVAAIQAVIPLALVANQVVGPVVLIYLLLNRHAVRGVVLELFVVQETVVTSLPEDAKVEVVVVAAGVVQLLLV